MNIDSTLINHLKQAVIEAGDIALNMRRQGLIVKSKPDSSPVTNADEKISKYIESSLKNLLPNAVIICEEGLRRKVSSAEYFWLIDPIDGTRSYIKGSDNFTVNIGLIKNNKPHLGFVYLPTTSTLYYTNHNLEFVHEVEAERQKAKNVSRPKTALVGASKISLKTMQYIQQKHIRNIMAISSSVKFCLLATGDADIYPKFGDTMEWDTAAGHAVLLASGGKIVELDNSPMQYGKERFANNNFLAIAANYRDE